MPASVINATVNGLNATGGNTAGLELQVSGTTAVTIDSSGNWVLTNPLPIASGGTGSNTGTFSGANVTNINASNISSGTVATARLATGTANNTTYLRGDQTWATVSAGGATGVSAQVFTSNGTFTIPSGVTALKVTVVGGGGGGGGSSAGGNTAGNSSVASGTQSITTIAGNGGSGGSISGARSSGGSASGGDINVAGGSGGSGGSNGNGGGGGSGGGLGGNGFVVGSGCYIGYVQGVGGAGFVGSGGIGASTVAERTPTGYGNGAGGVGNNSGGGGGGGLSIKWLTSLTPGNTLSVTVGAGGTGGTTSGVAGSGGIVIFEW